MEGALLPCSHAWYKWIFFHNKLNTIHCYCTFNKTHAKKCYHSFDQLSSAFNFSRNKRVFLHFHKHASTFSKSEAQYPKGLPHYFPKRGHPKKSPTTDTNTFLQNGETSCCVLTPSPPRKKMESLHPRLTTLLTSRLRIKISQNRDTLPKNLLL